ncbi:agmatine deiminase [Duganella sp. CF458]|uniref:agmatine deiminase family protein n=1 Tax=Duganella sp. CF458 TaxID=1884368 RepID=UPI0008F2BACA|nr:agmatine deiminase family protein [Duganella sp. CF458]SFF60958.1 agmatine deiminase [Duganella sp. CF458]
MPTRRTFMQQIAAGSLLGLTAGAAGARGIAASSWYMPDEHLPQERVFVSYAASGTVWKDWAAPVNAAVARLAQAIARYQPVTVFCRPAQLAQAQRECGLTNIDYFPLALDDIWVRDYGGCFVIDGAGNLGLVDFNFNGWGGKQRAASDTRVAKALSEDLEANYFVSSLVGEGGGIEVDGHGTGIMTESCWVNANRNPRMGRSQVEAELKQRLGLRKIIWLPGIRDKDITDAHVDFYARFVRAGVVVVNRDDDPQSYDYAVTRKHLDILKNATDADGRKLEIHILPPPAKPRSNRFSEGNPDFAAGYINYLPINGAVIAPQFGDAEADGYCRELLARLYPGRDIVQLDIDPIAAGGGGIHCVTKQMPRL